MLAMSARQTSGVACQSRLLLLLLVDRPVACSIRMSCFKSDLRTQPAIVKRRPVVALVLASQFCDHREQRHVQRNDNSTDTNAENADDDWLEQSQHIFRRGIDFVFV